MKFTIGIARFRDVNGMEKDRANDWHLATVIKMKADPRIESVRPITRNCFTSGIVALRNGAVKDAQLLGLDYLLMFDSNDMYPDPYIGTMDRLEYPGAKPFWDTSWEFLMANRDRPCVIAAPYCGPSPHNNIYVFRWRNKSNKDELPGNMHLDQFSREEAAVMAGIEEVAALPTGLCIYDMRVFNGMKKPYFKQDWGDEDHSELVGTEDVTNTRDISLAHYMTGGKMGGKIYCNWDAWAKHCKPEEIGKPKITTIESVGKNLQSAVRLGAGIGDKLEVRAEPRWVPDKLNTPAYIQTGDEWTAEEIRCSPGPSKGAVTPHPDIAPLDPGTEIFTNEEDAKKAMDAYYREHKMGPYAPREEVPDGDEAFALRD